MTAGEQRWAAGSVVTTSGLNKDDKTRVQRTIKAAGGDYSPNLSKRCTHIVTKPGVQSDKLTAARDRPELFPQSIVLIEWLERCSLGPLAASNSEQAARKPLHDTQPSARLSLFRGPREGALACAAAAPANAAPWNKSGGVQAGAPATGLRPPAAGAAWVFGAEQAERPAAAAPRPAPAPWEDLEEEDDAGDEAIVQPPACRTTAQKPAPWRVHFSQMEEGPLAAFSAAAPPQAVADTARRPWRVRVSSVPEDGSLGPHIPGGAGGAAADGGGADAGDGRGRQLAWADDIAEDMDEDRLEVPDYAAGRAAVGGGAAALRPYRSADAAPSAASEAAGSAAAQRRPGGSHARPRAAAYFPRSPGLQSLLEEDGSAAADAELALGPSSTQLAAGMQLVRQGLHREAPLWRPDNQHKLLAGEQLDRLHAAPEAAGFASTRPDGGRAGLYAVCPRSPGLKGLVEEDGAAAADGDDLAMGSSLTQLAADMQVARQDLGREGLGREAHSWGAAGSPQPSLPMWQPDQQHRRLPAAEPRPHFRPEAAGWGGGDSSTYAGAGNARSDAPACPRSPGWRAPLDDDDEGEPGPSLTQLAADMQLVRQGLGREAHSAAVSGLDRSGQADQPLLDTGFDAAQRPGPTSPGVSPAGLGGAGGASTATAGVGGAWAQRAADGEVQGAEGSPLGWLLQQQRQPPAAPQPRQGAAQYGVFPVATTLLSPPLWQPDRQVGRPPAAEQPHFLYAAPEAPGWARSGGSGRPSGGRAQSRAAHPQSPGLRGLLEMQGSVADTDQLELGPSLTQLAADMQLARQGLGRGAPLWRRGRHEWQPAEQVGDSSLLQLPPAAPALLEPTESAGPCSRLRTAASGHQASGAEQWSSAAGPAWEAPGCASPQQQPAGTQQYGCAPRPAGPAAAAAAATAAAAPPPAPAAAPDDDISFSQLVHLMQRQRLGREHVAAPARGTPPPADDAPQSSTGLDRSEGRLGGEGSSSPWPDKEQPASPVASPAALQLDGGEVATPAHGLASAASLGTLYSSSPSAAGTAGRAPSEPASQDEDCRMGSAATSVTARQDSPAEGSAGGSPASRPSTCGEAAPTTGGTHAAGAGRSRAPELRPVALLSRFSPLAAPLPAPGPPSLPDRQELSMGGWAGSDAAGGGMEGGGGASEGTSVSRESVRRASGEPPGPLQEARGALGTPVMTPGDEFGFELGGGFAGQLAPAARSGAAVAESGGAKHAARKMEDRTPLLLSTQGKHKRRGQQTTPAAMKAPPPPLPPGMLLAGPRAAAAASASAPQPASQGGPGPAGTGLQQLLHGAPSSRRRRRGVAQPSQPAAGPPPQLQPSQGRGLGFLLSSSQQHGAAPLQPSGAALTLEDIRQRASRMPWSSWAALCAEPHQLAPTGPGFGSGEGAQGRGWGGGGSSFSCLGALASGEGGGAGEADHMLITPGPRQPSSSDSEAENRGVGAAAVPRGAVAWPLGGRRQQAALGGGAGAGRAAQATAAAAGAWGAQQGGVGAAADGAGETVRLGSGSGGQQAELGGCEPPACDGGRAAAEDNSAAAEQRVRTPSQQWRASPHGLVPVGSNAASAAAPQESSTSGGPAGCVGGLEQGGGGASTEGDGGGRMATTPRHAPQHQQQQQPLSTAARHVMAAAMQPLPLGSQSQAQTSPPGLGSRHPQSSPRPAAPHEAGPPSCRLRQGCAAAGGSMLALATAALGSLELAAPSGDDSGQEWGGGSEAGAHGRSLSGTPVAAGHRAGGQVGPGPAPAEERSQAAQQQPCLPQSLAHSEGGAGAGAGMLAGAAVIIDRCLAPDKAAACANAVVALGGHVSGATNLGCGATAVVCEPARAGRWLAWRAHLLSPRCIARLAGQAARDDGAAAAGEEADPVASATADLICLSRGVARALQGLVYDARPDLEDGGRQEGGSACRTDGMREGYPVLLSSGFTPLSGPDPAAGPTDGRVGQAGDGVAGGNGPWASRESRRRFLLDLKAAETDVGVRLQGLGLGGGESGGGRQLSAPLMLLEHIAWTVTEPVVRAQTLAPARGNTAEQQPCRAVSPGGGSPAGLSQACSQGYDHGMLLGAASQENACEPQPVRPEDLDALAFAGPRVTLLLPLDQLGLLGHHAVTLVPTNAPPAAQHGGDAQAGPGPRRPYGSNYISVRHILSAVHQYYTEAMLPEEVAAAMAGHPSLRRLLQVAWQSPGVQVARFALLSGRTVMCGLRRCTLSGTHAVYEVQLA
ncbi:hypothetical protein TSOC_005326 [Tetrabaena socialis]|uniref:BRCT domain-containing protein n=1 Tax=Tetrabaena socialis TaxID=47790 RepID=A0A2J8A6L4_9CHLO|nr:hypothetical protein TSOC_005326 [Tetrabaena socialis]|eukprot:PNH08172.1 hypothetical protein TSOC_005326 [Tetrabaena socialis]